MFTAFSFMSELGETDKVGPPEMVQGHNSRVLSLRVGIGRALGLCFPIPFP